MHLTYDCVVLTFSYLSGPDHVLTLRSVSAVCRLWYTVAQQTCEAICAEYRKCTNFSSCLQYCFSLGAAHCSPVVVDWVSTLHKVSAQHIVAEGKELETGEPCLCLVSPTRHYPTEGLAIGTAFVPFYPAHATLQRSCAFPVRAPQRLPVQVVDGVLRTAAPLFAVTLDGRPCPVGVVSAIAQITRPGAAPDNVLSLRAGLGGVKRHASGFRHNAAVAHVTLVPMRLPCGDVEQQDCGEGTPLYTIMTPESLVMLKHHYRSYLLSNKPHIKLIFHCMELLEHASPDWVVGKSK